MDSHMHSHVERLDIVETGRRRRWSDDAKLKIVLESLAGPRLVSETARRHGVSRSQLVSWRRAFQSTRAAASDGPAFVPAVIAPAKMGNGQEESAAGARMEIVLLCGRRIIVDVGVDPEAIGRLVAVLDRR